MLAEQSLREGNLKETLSDLQEQVKARPADVKLRIFLFQLLAVLGDWDRALTQLNVVGNMDSGALAMVQAYREALRCEVLREKVFRGERSPLIFGEPEEWIALLIEALRLTAGERHEQAAELRGRALELAPATAGAIDGQPFEWIADADTRLGPVLEAVVNGRYYWVPVHRVREVHLEEPADLRDVVWTPAHLMWSNGGEAPAFIPTRYAGSERSEDDLVRMARRTEWIEAAPDVYLGAGQRLLATDLGEHAIMDCRHITLATEAGDEGGGHA